MFEIREFYGREAIPYKEICSRLFRYPDKDLQDIEEYGKKLEAADREREKDFVRLGAFYDGKLYAAMELIPFNVYIDGEIRKMCGIGGVVSLPDMQKKGAVKFLFKHAFKLMREKGQYISHLYPFNADYYRQYGYDISCEHRRWSVPVEFIRKDSSGGFVLYDGSQQMKRDIKEIYSHFSEKHNMAVCRSEENWEKYFEKHKPYVQPEFAYLHYTNNKPDAYMRYTIRENAERPQDFDVSELWYSSYEGLRGVLSYFVTQRAYADRILLTLPKDADLSAVIEFCGGWGKRNAEVYSYFDGVSRCVDAEKFLELKKCRGKGRICVKIEEDEYCPWNNGCYTLEFGEKNIVTHGGEPDIAMDINSFTSLILGRCTLENAEIFPGVKIYKNRETLEKVFFERSCFIDIHF